MYDFQNISTIGIFISCKTAFRWMLWDFLDDKSKLGLINGLVPSSKPLSQAMFNIDQIQLWYMALPGADELIHHGRDKMDAISQKTF